MPQCRSCQYRNCKTDLKRQFCFYKKFPAAKLRLTVIKRIRFLLFATHNPKIEQCEYFFDPGMRTNRIHVKMGMT